MSSGPLVALDGSYDVMEAVSQEGVQGAQGGEGGSVSLLQLVLARPPEHNKNKSWVYYAVHLFCFRVIHLEARPSEARPQRPGRASEAEPAGWLVPVVSISLFFFFHILMTSFSLLSSSMTFALRFSVICFTVILVLIV